jgi:hypothetical protein
VRDDDGFRDDQRGRLHHTRVPGDQAAGFGAGWHGHLDALATVLAGQDLDPRERYRELQPEYSRRFG